MTDSSSQDGGAPPDGDLARAAASGDRSALDALLRRHQRWIYNLALRMLWNAHDAEDATQEILLKIATRLGSYRGESTLRTWAWRIAANHILSRRRGRTEEVIHGFECYGAALAATAETEWNEVGPEDRLLVQEAAIGCTVGLLLCLDREQRLAFVLGEIFGPGGRTEVSVAREAPATAVVRVRDDGIGIAPEVRSRLFEPFAQSADTVDRNRGGLGLGLALAKALVDLHGGAIVARSGDPSGTELVVSLPLLAQQG